MRKLIIAAGVLALAGCGSVHTPPAGTSAPAASPAVSPAVNYGQQYLADVAGVNAALGKVNPDAATVTDPTIVAVRAAALMTASELLRQSWPANAAADVHGLALATEKLATDMQADALMQANLPDDVATLGADAQAVRADLGLPAAS